MKNKSYSNSFFVFLILVGCAGTTSMRLSEDEQLYLSNAVKSPTTFNVSKEELSTAWGRAQSWIGRYSSMKLQVVTDYVLQTYNPGGGGVNFGYYVTRTDLSDSLRIEVRCLTDNMFSGNDRKQNEHLLAYYIMTGKEPPTSRIIAK